jgi:hypothetical protein
MAAALASTLLKPPLVIVFLVPLTARLGLGNFGVLVISLVALLTSRLFEILLLSPSTVVQAVLCLLRQGIAL